MGRYFEKISFEQFSKDISNDIESYNEYELPVRSTKYSAGYDFKAIFDFTIMPGEIKRIPTGYKSKCESNEFLLLCIRSSVGFKYNVRMCNSIGIIDSDYYNNSSNEGHMWVALQNEGDKPFEVKKGERYVQGIFVSYLTVDDEGEQEIRSGGIGSTNKGDGKNE